LANYRNENENEDLLKNPYLEAFWKLSNIMYDQSVPELFPTAVANEMFGNNAEEIAKSDANYKDSQKQYARIW